MTIDRWLEKHVNTQPEDIALSGSSLIDSERCVTYRKLHSNIRHLRIALNQEIAHAENSIIVICLPNSIELAELIVSCWISDITFCIIHTETKCFHLKHILMDSDATDFIFDETRSISEELSDFLDEKQIKRISLQMLSICAQCLPVSETVASITPKHTLSPTPLTDSESIACYIYTSGSTGLPKAVICTKSSVVFATEAIQSVLKYRANDRIGLLLPMAFDYGMYQLFLSVFVGSHLHISDDRHSGPLLLNWLGNHAITVFPATPILINTTVRLQKRSQKDLPTLRLITNTGSHLNTSLIEDFLINNKHCTVYVMYGLTECKRVSIMPYDPDSPNKYSVGKPLPNTCVYIVDKEERLLGPCETGQIVVSGSHVMSGYKNCESLSRSKFRTFNQLPCFFTGDIGYLNEHGYLYFEGRNDDQIKRKGFRISTFEISKAAMDLPPVKNAGTLIKKDVIILLIELTDNYKLINHIDTISTIKNALLTRLESFKMPDRIQIVNKIQYSKNGKNLLNETLEMMNV